MKLSIKNKQELYGLGYPFGGFLVDELETAYSLITGGYNTQHNSDDTHGTITASGPVSERGRATAMGDWIAIPFNAANFGAGGTMTWTVTSANQVTFAYTLVGTTVFFQVKLVNTSTAGAASSTLRLTLPIAYASSRQQFGTYHYIDNAVHGIGMWGISAVTNAPVVLELSKIDFTTNWAISASLTEVRLSGAIEVSALTL